jgi:hypothetical protein
MFCKKIRPGIKKLIDYIDDKLLRYSDVALDVTTAIRKALESWEAVKLVDLTPTTLDNHLRNVILEALDRAIITLSISQTCNVQTTPEERLACYVEELRKLRPALWKPLLMKLAQTTTAYADGRYEKKVYDAIVQVEYTAKKLS